MKFFKKLSSNNSGSPKKLLFLKSNKKEKDEKSKTEVETESWLDLNLPNDFSSSLDLPHFDRQETDNNTISNSSTNSSATTPAYVEQKSLSSIAIDTAAITVEEDRLQDVVDLKNEEINASLDLELQQNKTESTKIQEQSAENESLQQDEQTERLQHQCNDDAETDIEKEDSSYGVDDEEKERDSIDKEQSDLTTSNPDIQLSEDADKRHTVEHEQQDEIALSYNTTEDNLPEIVKVENNHSTPQNEQGTEQSSHEPSNTTSVAQEECNIITQAPLKLVKNVDKRRSMQSFIPRKQTSKDERSGVKDKKRQSCTSSLPVPSSKLIVTTTIVVDTSDASASPSSTTSTSTTATNTSNSSNTSGKKQSAQKLYQQQQQHSKIPIASSFSSLKACSTQPSSSHHMSRLPKKINNI